MLTLDGNTLRWQDVVAVARGGVQAALSPDARARMLVSRKVVEDHIAAGDVVYGVTTGFGKFAQIAIPPDKRLELQKNLVRSHSAGVGEPFGRDVVRAMLLLRANALAKGASGVRPEVADTLLAMLNGGVHPIVPQIGSLGASGDLAPLAHLALVLIGEGEAEFNGARMSGADAMQKAGVRPLELQAKEGLALLNGTQGMSALAVMLRADGGDLCKLADLAGALSIDATLSSYVPCDEAIHRLRPYAGIAWLYVLHFHCGNKPLQSAKEKLLRKSPCVFSYAVPPVFEKHLPCSKIGQGFPRVSKVKVGFAVAFTLE